MGRLRCGDLLPSSSRARPGCSYEQMAVLGLCSLTPLTSAIALHGWLRIPAEHGWLYFKVKDTVLPCCLIL